MTGQGRPHRAIDFSRKPVGLIRVGCCALWLLTFVAPLAAAETSLRLRIEWGGTQERRWAGTISVTEGQVFAPAALGLEADEPGSIFEDDGRVIVATPSRRRYDGVDVQIVAPLEAKLVIELRPADQRAAGDRSPRAAPIVVPLEQIVEEFHSSVLDGQGSRVVVRRAPGDKLRVTLDRQSLVYAPDDTVAWQVQPNMPQVAAGTRVRLQARLAAVGTGRVFWNDEREFTVGAEPIAAQPFEFVVPAGEGAYEVVLNATRRNLTDRLTMRGAMDERHWQFVVVGPNRIPMGTSLPAWDVLVEIDPAHPGWWNRVAQLPGNLPYVNSWTWRRGPLGNGEVAIKQHSLGALVQLDATQAGSDPRWEAYPLAVQRPGQPHVLEVEYPSDAPQSLDISIVEPNAAGAVLPIGLDSGVYLPAEAAGDKPAMLKHRLVFWPRTEAPLALIVNRGAQTRATYGKIRLLGPKGNSRSAAALATISNPLNRATDPLPDVHLPATQEAGAPKAERLIAAYFDRPLLPENFSAGGTTDTSSSPSGRTLDDWSSFWHSGQRLTEYLRYVGYGGAMVSVYADGSSLYPSQLLQPTPRYDDGVLLIGGHDPARKDVLELLLRLFDREELLFIAGLQFSAPLPELETLRRQGGGAVAGIDLIGADGQPWRARNTPRRELAPYYNPLDSRVQEAMLNVVRELAERGRDHHSFAGIALQLSADGFAQFPGAEWGYDEDTLARFERETRVDLGAAGPDALPRRAELLAGRYRSVWLAWRAKQLAQFYERMSAEMRAVHPNAKLHLVTAELFARPELQSQLRPSLTVDVKPDDLLLQAGIDGDTLAQSESVALLRSMRVAPLDDLTSQGPNLELNLAEQFERSLQGGRHAGTLFYHERNELPLPSFDAKSPFRKTYTRLVTVASPSGDYGRRRFIHALAAQDSQSWFDGGWMLPLGQEQATVELMNIFRQLPAGVFQPIGESTQPLAIRTLQKNGRTYMYAVNDSPWKVSAALIVNGSGSFRMQPLGSQRRGVTLQGEGAQRVCNLDLNPYDLVGTVFDGDVRISKPTVNVPPQLAESLEARIRDLWARAAALKSAAPIAGLANADFEQATRREGPVAGWELKPQAGARWELDATEAHDGKQSLHISAGAAGAELNSVPLLMPATGRLSLGVWLRAPANTQPTLRLGVEVLDGTTQVRNAVVGAPPAVQPLPTSWGQFVLPIHELPTDGPHRVRVRFELLGAGEIWIDDVQLFDLDFSEDERLELSKELALIEYKKNSGNYRDCLRLLEGYWPRFLVAHVPAVDVPLAKSPAELGPAGETKPEAERRAGLMDRFRRAIPDFLR
ncbi:MAG: hypothetical protein JSS27_04030 [Planctomycetes bacterium]|nr:hypothetical protein [Planctomycetota bacterium]